MSECNPYGEFKWLKNVDGFDVNSICEKIEYFLEVDLKYPGELKVGNSWYQLTGPIFFCLKKINK